MSRITKIDPKGTSELCKGVPFERNDFWSQILGPIPSHTEDGERGEELAPDSEYILQRLIEFLVLK